MLVFLLTGERENMICKADFEDKEALDNSDSGKSEMDMSSPIPEKETTEAYTHSMEVYKEPDPSFRPIGVLKRLSSYEGAILNTQMQLELGLNWQERSVPKPEHGIKSIQGSRNGNNNLAFSKSPVVALHCNGEVSKNGDQETSLNNTSNSDSDCSPSPDSRRLTVDSGIFLCGNDVFGGGSDQKPKQHSNYKFNHLMQTNP